MNDDLFKQRLIIYLHFLWISFTFLIMWLGGAGIAIVTAMMLGGDIWRAGFLGFLGGFFTWPLLAALRLERSSEE